MNPETLGAQGRGPSFVYALLIRAYPSHNLIPESSKASGEYKCVRLTSFKTRAHTGPLWHCTCLL